MPTQATSSIQNIRTTSQQSTGRINTTKFVTKQITIIVVRYKNNARPGFIPRGIQK